MKAYSFQHNVLSISAWASLALVLLATDTSALPQGLIKRDNTDYVQRINDGTAHIRARHWRHGDHQGGGGCKIQTNQTEASGATEVVAATQTPSEVSDVVSVTMASSTFGMTTATDFSVVAAAPTDVVSSSSDVATPESSPSFTLDLQQQRVAATPTPSPSAASTESSSTATGDQQTYLDLHNSFRAKYGASGLAWNDTLASYALDWAKRCAFHHSGGPSGENLAASYGRPDPIGDGIAGWEKEASLYDWDHPGYKNTTGHFTQMVWKGTMSLGCAKVECGANTVFPSESYPQQDFVVCEYYPGGNIINEGAFGDNVGKLQN